MKKFILPIAWVTVLILILITAVYLFRGVQVPIPIIPTPFISIPVTLQIASTTSSTSTTTELLPEAPHVRDSMNIRMLYKTISGGRIWNSKWNNGKERIIRSGVRDIYDPEFIARGNGSVQIDGRGIATLIGDSPRMYVYDVQKLKKWNNVEVTIYGKRVSETTPKQSQGIVIGARSEHQDVVNTETACLGRTYYARLLYDGRSVFEKEVIHAGAYSTNKPEENYKTVWNTPDNTMPKNVWIGVKYIVHTNEDGKSVTLQMYRDLTNGKNGGNWEKVSEYVDNGEWSQTDTGVDVVAKCGYPASKVLLDPGTSILIRNDSVSNVQYKLFSIREIK